jgi:ABC-type transporter Mla maintaining outer membrane lipid asymmetry ATPase subunit MlaF
MSDSEKPSSDQVELPTEERKNLLVPDVQRWRKEDGPIISLKNVHKSFGEQKVLQGIDLEINVGEITVIIGASASGKSVLIKLMNGLLFADSGEVRLFGQDPAELSDVELDKLRKRMGTLFQNYALFDSMTVVENTAFPLVENKAMGVAKAQKLSAELIESLELGHALQMYPSSLSGGMKKRVALARSIISNPEIVLFDEPTTGLDPIMMEFVDDMIATIKERFGLTSVVISHDMASTFRLADSIAVLQGGKIILHDSPEVVKGSDDERVRQLIFASDKTDIDVGDDTGEEEDQSIAEENAAVIVRDLYKSFDGRGVLKGANLTAPKKEITVLIGGSGSGKSVLMKHILGLFRPDSGRVDVLGKDVTNLNEAGLSELRTQIGMLFQHAALFDSMSIEDNIAFPLLERRESVSYKEAKERADQVMEKLKLTDIAKRFPPSVSNGQQKRASLARALITEPVMMIYDEPTTGQDPIMCSYVEEMILEAHESFGLTSLIISHDMASTFRIGDHVAMLYHGEIIAEGPPSMLLHSEDERVQEFVFAADVAEKKRAD